jgi:hypothetical protein
MSPTMRYIFIFFLIICLTPFNSLFALNYYVSSSGNDDDTGISPIHAWRTTSRINATRFQPGDQILFAGGQIFKGGIRLSTCNQKNNQPIVFRSYGVGRATIQTDDTYGFYAQNQAGIELRNLAFVGSGRLSNQNSGIGFYLDSANTQLQYLRLDSLDVSGYEESGISIGSWNGQSGYSDVRITNCQVHANGEAGISSYQFWPLPTQAHHNWYVGACTVYDNSGRADITTYNTGNGIVLSGIDRVIIEKCTAYHNGWLNANPTGGPVGIWGWSCNNLVIQYCESHHNQSGTSLDGGGFDLDGGCTNSVMQYNYSHDNQGPGYLLAQFGDAEPMHDLTIRYNISENDARGYNQGAIEVWSSGANGGIVRANIHNNTVKLGRPADGSTPKAVYIMSGGITAVTLRNNLLETSAGLPVLTTVTNSELRLEGNCYWSSGEPLVLNWNGTTYNSLPTWREATGQEALDAGTRQTGICANPYPTPNTNTTITLSELTGYIPGPTSPLVGAGLNLENEFGISPGALDFFGNPTPLAGIRGNIGASEMRVVLLATTIASASNNPAWCQIYPTVVRGEIHLAIDKVINQPIQLQLFDLLGRQCWSQEQTINQFQKADLTLPIMGIAAGHYILHVQSGSRVLRQALVVAAE